MHSAYSPYKKSNFNTFFSIFYVSVYARLECGV